MKRNSYTDANTHWFPPFYGNWPDSTLPIGLFPYKMGGAWGQDCCQPKENGTSQYPV